MKSAYPSSQSFFDDSSDSIRAADIDKCRTSSSFSSLSDLFGKNPNGKSDLFSNIRTPVFVPAEVTFPQRKNRVCEDRAAEKVSIWNEWGSGECPGEESSGLLSDMFKSSTSELFRAPSSNLFPNLGSANVSLIPEEFTFPERRKREDESWRERRGFRQDWIPSVPTVENSVRESTAMISSVADFISKTNTFPVAPSKPSTLFSSSRVPSIFSNLASPGPSTEEPEFPARKKRNENPFWQDYSSGGSDVATPSSSSPAKQNSTSGTSCTAASGVHSLSELYTKSPSTSKCSSLFSNLGAPNVKSEEVVFPTRRKNPDRNAWRDWSNTGYSDWAGSDSEEDEAAEGPQPKAAAQVQVQPASPEKLRSLDNRPLKPSEVPTLRRTTPQLKNSVKVVVKEVVSHPKAKETVRSGGPSEAVGASGLSSQIRDPQQAHNAGRLEESNTESYDDEDVEDVHLEERYRSSRRDLHEQRISRQKVQSFPPPLGFLGRQGSLRDLHHGPWVTMQPVRSEGRFMLKEVAVTQPMIFEPIREQGRLVLQLIRQDSGKSDTSPVYRNAQSCASPNESSNAVAKEAALVQALKVSDVKEDAETSSSSTSTASSASRVLEHEAVEREAAVKEKVKKSNKGPKIYPECCLPAESPVYEVHQASQELVSGSAGALEPIISRAAELVVKAEDSPRVDFQGKYQPPMQPQSTKASHPGLRLAFIPKEFEKRKNSFSRAIPESRYELVSDSDGCQVKSQGLLKSPGVPHDLFSTYSHAPPSRLEEAVADCNSRWPEPAATFSHRDSTDVSGQGGGGSPFWNPTGLKLRDGDRSAFRCCIPMDPLENNINNNSNGVLSRTSSLQRSRSVRNTSLSEFGRTECDEDETSMIKRGGGGRELEDSFAPSPSVTAGQGFDGSSLGLQTSVNRFQWPSRKRPDGSGDAPDSRLAMVNYPMATAASFSCAEGVGKRHQQIWEQPCVS